LGNLFPEKGRLTEDFNLGNVERGFSEEKSLHLIEEYERISEGLCDHCWSVRLCPACYATGSIHSRLSQDRQRRYSAEIRDVIDRGLKLYVKLLEEGVDLSDRMEVILE